ncbi:MAG TPA: PHP domain-containing protein [Bryobacteraceae bacterium]|nr:PHP domain-containing protein [Bryobacteraceae bacterium]
MIDLHTHSTASDGTDAPARLIEIAGRTGLRALSLTDHDTLAGCDGFGGFEGEVELVRGIELSVRILEESDPSSRSAHLLGYFFEDPPLGFRLWLESLRQARRRRNVEMARLLNEQGILVSIEEAEQLGRNITGRPHFARLMRKKGYVKTWEEAFNVYLGEHGSAYVEREDPPIGEGIERIKAAGGVTSLAHPGRLGKVDAASEGELVARLAGWGLDGIEAWHPDHDRRDVERYVSLAGRLDLIVTGGSDYHGEYKPFTGLGGWNGDRIPSGLLDGLRRRALNGHGRG